MLQVKLLNGNNSVLADERDIVLVHCSLPLKRAITEDVVPISLINDLILTPSRNVTVYFMSFCLNSCKFYFLLNIKEICN